VLLFINHGDLSPRANSVSHHELDISIAVTAYERISGEDRRATRTFEVVEDLGSGDRYVQASGSFNSCRWLKVWSIHM
jgi:hypothetical protein